MNIIDRMRAAMTAFRNPYGTEPTLAKSDHDYDLLWSFYVGSWRTDPLIVAQQYGDPRLYRQTRLLWNMARATVRLYAQSVYQGDLSTDGKPLPDGTRGAIPIDPQTGNRAPTAAAPAAGATAEQVQAAAQAASTSEAQSDEQLRRACAELWAMWNWRQHMSLRPKYAAILGDVLTELVDDTTTTGKVLPRTVWPGYVTQLDLDLVGNVTRYVIEYVAPDDGPIRYNGGRDYAYRKEVDKRQIQYFLDDKPFDYFGEGATVANIYGFVPAIWDRHEIVFGDRGLGAFEPALVAMREMNSVFSHALDYQRKQFGAPVGYKGAVIPTDRNNRATLAGPPPISLENRMYAAEDASQTMNLLPMDATGDFVTVKFDIGQTVAMLQEIQQTLASEFPESKFGQELLQMTQLTAPGAERALGPIVGMVRAARANHDPQTVKLHQMAIAIMGERLRRGDIPSAIRTERPARYAVFDPFNLQSYGQGLLDMTIPDREVIPETIDERVDRLIKIQQLDGWALEQLGYSAADIARIQGQRQAAAGSAADAFARAFNAGNVGGRPGPTGPAEPNNGATGPTGVTGAAR